MDKVTLNDVLSMTEYAELACEKAEEHYGLSAESIYSDVVQKGVATYILGTLHLYRTTAIKNAQDEVDNLVRELIDRHEGKGRIPLFNFDNERSMQSMIEDMDKAGIPVEQDGYNNYFVRMEKVEDLLKIQEVAGEEVCIDVVDGKQAVVIGIGGC